jgi:hypothetical protein
MNIPTFDLEGMFTNYRQGKFVEVIKTIIEMVKHFNTSCYTQLDRVEKQKFDNCVMAAFYLLTQPDFQIPADYAKVLVNVNHILTNMLLTTGVMTPDGLLQRVLIQDNNFTKIAILMTCHTPLKVEPDALFQLNAELASVWWLNYQTAAIGTLTQEVHDRVVKHLQAAPLGLNLPDLRTAPIYFQCTYFSPETDNVIKQALNNQIRRKLAGAKIHSIPCKKSIAILTDRWQPTTAVYKSCYHQIAKLTEKYDLTLVHYSEDVDNRIDRGLFKEVRRVFIKPDMKSIDFSSIKNNDFQFAYFPDIGMNYESVCLSNMQVAPIMATGYGHPVSTFGSKVDYFIGGIDAEVPELAGVNYSERLVLIPGIGAHPVFPNYTKENPDPSEFWINCCWTSPKINYTMVKALLEIKKRATRPVRFQFFPSWTIGRYQAAMPFIERMTELFNGDVAIYFDTPYQEYLRMLENGRFGLDSYPFGGYNTVVDNLFVGCPMVTLEGTRFFNKASSALMRKVGIKDLIASDVDSYIHKALLLIDNPRWLKQVREEVSAMDLRTLLVDNNEPKYFADAIDYLVTNHSALKQENSRKPLILV